MTEGRQASIVILCSRRTSPTLLIFAARSFCALASSLLQDDKRWATRSPTIGCNDNIPEVWDDATANRLGEYETVDEARAVLRAVLHESGPGAAGSLAVLSYTRVGREAGGYEVATVLEGADFVTQESGQAARSAP
jgi:hypothetical protein